MLVATLHVGMTGFQDGGYTQLAQGVRHAQIWRMRFWIYLDSWWIPEFVVDSGRFPNDIHATYNEIHRNINVFHVDSWILTRNPEWIPTCSVRDSSRDGPLKLAQLQRGLSSLGQNIIHSPVARVVCGWWAFAYKLTRMPGSTENVPHRAIWHLRGNLDKTPVSLLCCLTLSGWFDCIGVHYSSMRIGSNL